MKPCGALAVAALVLTSMCVSTSANSSGEWSEAGSGSVSGRQLLRTQPQGKPEEEKPAEEPEDTCYYVDADKYKEEPEPKYGYKCEEVKNDYGKVIKYKCCKHEESPPPEDTCYYVDYKEYEDAPEPKYGYKCKEVKIKYGKVVKYKCCLIKKPTIYEPPKPKCTKHKGYLCCLVAKKDKHLYKGQKCVKIKRGYYSCCKKIPQPPKPVCIWKKFGKRVKRCCKTHSHKKYKHNKHYKCFRKYKYGKKVTFCCKLY